jgi:hypothetical protein
MLWATICITNTWSLSHRYLLEASRRITMKMFSAHSPFLPGELRATVRANDGHGMYIHAVASIGSLGTS